MLCEPIKPIQALDWGLVNRVVPRADLDETVAALAAGLRAKLPEALRYTKTQLNWWRDLVWSQTVTHARDWLAVHSTADETREAVAAFLKGHVLASERGLVDAEAWPPALLGWQYRAGTSRRPNSITLQMISPMASACPNCVQ